MKRILALSLAALSILALFGGFVYVVLVAAQASEPATTTVYGPTVRRAWATTAAVIGLVGVIGGGLALFRPTSRFGVLSGQPGVIVALLAGTISLVTGAVNLAGATGGPGTGNGVVGGAAAVVLGLMAVAVGGLSLARSRRTV